MLIEEKITAAAQWWADNLNGGKQDAGDAKLNATIELLSLTEPITEEQRERFKHALEDEIVRALTPELSDRFVLTVDYDPDPRLRAAAQKSGIRVAYCATFPIKTTMIIGANSVKVGHGYGQPFKTIWGAVACSSE